MAAALTALYLLRGVLLTLGLSAVIAYILFPLARQLERIIPGGERAYRPPPQPGRIPDFPGFPGPADRRRRDGYILAD